LSFFWNAHNDFFEEVAKYRAARRIWARHMKERYGAKEPRSLLMRFHTQTAGCSLTEQQPENNIVRTAIQAFAGVMGGTQSLHTNSMDETYALPTEKAVKIALRTQQVIAYESGVANVIDPLGGSYYVEALTDRMEAEAEKYFRQIENLGGVVAGIEEGFFQRELAGAASRYQEEIDARRRVIVGVNEFIEQDERLEIPILRIDPRYEARPFVTSRT
jgi:methylmalonyl-CoA mutase N-terminal domain/subunit